MLAYTLGASTCAGVRPLDGRNSQGYLSIKIFLSHSSRQKLFVRELRRRLPQSIDLWIDESEIIAGDPIPDSLASAIDRECDLFIAIIDAHAAASPWVELELRRAARREAELGRTFLLPVVLEMSAWDALQVPGLRERKFLTCLDFSDHTIDSFVRSLIEEILAWLSRLHSHRAEAVPGGLSMVEEADRVTSAIADEIKSIILPHREDNPLEIDALHVALAKASTLRLRDRQALLDLLERLISRNLLNGVAYDDQVVYLSQERYSFKSGIHSSLKRRIARAAASLVRSGTTVALDGGSTTLELARSLTSRLRSHSLHDLRVITNSIPAANELLGTLSTMGSGDIGSVAEVHLLGGRCRPVSLTVVPANTAVAEPNDLSNWRAAFDSFGTIDVAFLGANGIYKQEAFANHSGFETAAKRMMVEHATRKVILVDASKFVVPQDRPFAAFQEELEVLTAASSDHELAINAFRKMIAGTPTRLTVLDN